MINLGKRMLGHKISHILYRLIKDQVEKAIEGKCWDDGFIQIQTQLIDFRNATDDMLASKVESKTNLRDLVNRFKQFGIPLMEVQIDIADFEKWLKEFPDIIKFYETMGDVKIEKSLEHYLTMRHLGISQNDVCIDIAAAASPFADIIGAHLKNRTFKQDLVFEKGVHGNKIGGDAGNIPIPDGFADVLTLHCAFECFQGDADIRFIKEASRILKEGGRLGIVPLYINHVYFVKTGPKYDKRKVNVEKDARWIWRDDAYDKEPFSRHYSPESFKNRILDNVGSLKYELLHFTNLKDLEEYFQGQRFYCHFFFKAVKN